MKKLRIFAIVGIMSLLLSSCDVMLAILDAAAKTEQTTNDKNKTGGGKTNDTQKKSDTNEGTSGGKTRDKK